MRLCICTLPRLHRSIIELAAQRGYTVEETAVSVHEAMEVRVVQRWGEITARLIVRAQGQGQGCCGKWGHGYSTCMDVGWCKGNEAEPISG